MQGGVIQQAARTQTSTRLLQMALAVLGTIAGLATNGTPLVAKQAGILLVTTTICVRDLHVRKEITVLEKRISFVLLHRDQLYHDDITGAQSTSARPRLLIRILKAVHDWGSWARRVLHRNR